MEQKVPSKGLAMSQAFRCFSGWVLVLMSLVVGVKAGADTTTAHSSIGTGIVDSPAVLDGAFVYLFGGCTTTACPSPYVSRYSPSDGSFTLMGPTFPLPLRASAVAWTGRYAFIFGGYHGSVERSEIFRYEPATNSLKQMAAKLPSGRGYSSAVWTGSKVLVFGGRQGPLNDYGHYTSEIVEYDPSNDTVRVLPQKLPAKRGATSAIWDGSQALIFGGRGCESVPCSYLDVPRETADIVSFDPNSGSVHVAGSLPSARAQTSAVFDGQHAFVFGGVSSSSGYLDQIVRYSPTTQEAPAMCSRLPAGKAGTSAVWRGPDALVMFGHIDGSTTSNKIVRFDRTVPSAPVSLSAQTGRRAGEIDLSWQLPPAQCAEGITAVRVYRGESNGSETFLAELPKGSTFTDSGLPAGARRHYRVSVLSGTGESVLSEGASASAPSPPDAPRRLTVVPGPGVGQATLIWQPPSRESELPITSYRIYRAEVGGLETFVGEAPAATLPSFVDNGCKVGVICYYTVAAMNDLVEGVRSGPAYMAGWRP